MNTATHAVRRTSPRLGDDARSGLGSHLGRERVWDTLAAVLQRFSPERVARARGGDQQAKKKATREGRLFYVSVDRLTG